MLHQSPSLRAKKNNRCTPRVELLEERLAPVVGANADAPAVNPGTDLDGVVLIQNANFIGTGAPGRYLQAHPHRSACGQW